MDLPSATSSGPDLATAALAVGTFILGGIFNAVVSEIQAMRAEGRTREREAATEQRVDRRAAEDRLRAAIVRDIEETRRYIIARGIHLIARASGRPTGEFPTGGFPNADVSLVGDPALMAQDADLLLELMAKAPGTPLSMDDLERMGRANSAMLSALKEQEARALSGAPLRTPDPAEVAKYFTAELNIERLAKLKRTAGARAEPNASPASAENTGV